MYKSDPTFAVSVFQDTLLPLLGLPTSFCPQVRPRGPLCLQAALFLCPPVYLYVLLQGEVHPLPLSLSLARVPWLALLRLSYRPRQQQAMFPGPNVR